MEQSVLCQVEPELTTGNKEDVACIGPKTENREDNQQTNEGPNILNCSKCGRPYKTKRAYDRHVKLCVKNIKAGELKQVQQCDGALLKVSSRAPPEHISRAAMRKEKILKLKQLRKSTNCDGDGEPKTSLLEQADNESRWQLIQYKVNDILYDTDGQSQTPITQPLQPSKFYSNSGGAGTSTSNTNYSCKVKSSLWKAARGVSDNDNLVSSISQVTSNNYRDTEIPANFKNRKLTLEKCRERFEPVVRENIRETTEKATESSTVTGPSGEQKGGPVIASTSSLLGSKLFSDLTIRTADAEIAAHKVMLAARYPVCIQYLEDCDILDLSSVSTDDVMLWLNGVYVGNISIPDAASSIADTDIRRYVESRDCYKQSADSALTLNSSKNCKKRKSNSNPRRTSIKKRKVSNSNGPHLTLDRNELNDKHTLDGPVTDEHMHKQVAGECLVDDKQEQVADEHVTSCSSVRSGKEKIKKSYQKKDYSRVKRIYPPIFTSPLLSVITSSATS